MRPSLGFGFAYASCVEIPPCARTWAHVAEDSLSVP